MKIIPSTQGHFLCQCLFSKIPESSQQNQYHNYGGKTKEETKEGCIHNFQNILPLKTSGMKNSIKFRDKNLYIFHSILLDVLLLETGLNFTLRESCDSLRNNSQCVTMFTLKKNNSGKLLSREMHLFFFWQRMSSPSFFYYLNIKQFPS